MTETDVLGALPEKLKQARKQQGLSLEAVAEISGVSKSMVSQIERGVSSPTVATLWNLTRALGVEFSGLLDSAGSARNRIEILSAGATPTIENMGSGCKIRLLSPPSSVGAHEVYELLFDGGGVLASEAHWPGAREHLTVIDGRLQVTAGGDIQVAGPGDTARYGADQTHEIRAVAGPARAFLIVQGSG